MFQEAMLLSAILLKIFIASGNSVICQINKLPRGNKVTFLSKVWRHTILHSFLSKICLFCNGRNESKRKIYFNFEISTVRARPMMDYVDVISE